MGIINKMLKFIALSIVASLTNAVYLNKTDAGCTYANMTHQVLDLPAFDTTNNFPCMFAGFVKSSDTLDHNLFYWLYKTEETANNDSPVTIWINGGPGSSSAFGNFLENGPLKILSTVNKTEGAADTYSFLIKNNPQGSWANKSTMIYVDQPIGTGYSYSLPAVYLDNMTAVSDEFVQFMKNLFL